MNTTRKSFDELISDYDFFVSHSSEAAANCQGIIESLSCLSPPKIRDFFDFGCGDGAFTHSLLTKLRLPNLQTITLIEPQESYLSTAIKKLSPIAITHGYRNFPESGISFDLGISNHVLYYVPDLIDTISSISNCLQNAFAMILVHANEENDLIKFWKIAFDQIGSKVPYNLASDLKEALEASGLRYSLKTVESHLKFADLPGNRLKILRFLLGHHYSSQNDTKLLRIFDEFRVANEDQICMSLSDDIYLLEGANLDASSK